MTAILVDTHVLLWMRIAPQKLGRNERQNITAALPRYVSIVSFWEVAILASLGRVAADDRLFQIPPGFELLAVEPKHCQAVIVLPQHHRDPFDRMLIAQAMVENLLLITRDRAVASYRGAGVAILYPE